MIKYWKMLFARACLYEWVGEALVQCDPLGGVEHTYLIQEVAQLKNLPGVKLGRQSIYVKCMVCEKILSKSSFITFFSCSSGSLAPPVSSWSRFLT